MSDIKQKVPGYIGLAISIGIVMVLGNWVDTLFTGKWYIDGPLWFVTMVVAFRLGYYAQELMAFINRRMPRGKEES